MAVNEPQMTWKQLLDAINMEFSKEEGETNIDHMRMHLKRCMQAYTSNRADWKNYALFDPQGQEYTRNLVSDGNGKYNLIVLCWPEGIGSPIHNHAKSDCLMKILRGPIKETMFDWPIKAENAQPGDQYPEQSMREIRCNIYQTDEVGHINDSHGLHRVENPSHTDGAVSLHLYFPPITLCNKFDDKTAHTEESEMTFDSRDGKPVATD